MNKIAINNWHTKERNGELENHPMEKHRIEKHRGGRVLECQIKQRRYGEGKAWKCLKNRFI